MQARGIIIALMVVGVGLLGPPRAGAHAFLEHAEPRVGSTGPAPAAVRLQFTEPVELSFCRLTVRDARGEPIRTGGLEQPQPEALRMELPPLSPGRYTVHWAVTAVDTHQTEGSFEFTVRPP